MAGLGEVELEIAPVGYRREGTSSVVVAPAAVANYGFASGFEAVLEGRQDVRLDAGQHSSLQDAAISVKSVLRRGSLQGASGLSVALEIGVLAPGSERGIGTHVSSIFSFQNSALSLHLNLDNGLSSLRYDASASLILEGPARWRLRPVAEGLLEREFEAGAPHRQVAESLLLGGIARWTNAVSFDLAVRIGRADGRRDEEARAGLTVGFSAW